MYLGVALNFAYALITLLTASRKSFSVHIFLRERMANMPASVQTLRISAPVSTVHSVSGWRTCQLPCRHCGSQRLHTVHSNQSCSDIRHRTFTDLRRLDIRHKPTCAVWTEDIHSPVLFVHRTFTDLCCLDARHSLTCAVWTQNIH